MDALELKGYKILKRAFGQSEAITIIEYFENKLEQKHLDKKEIVFSKKFASNSADVYKYMFVLFICQLVIFWFILLVLKK